MGEGKEGDGGGEGRRGGGKLREEGRGRWQV